MEKFKCCNCGKEFVDGNDANGIPNGLGFVAASGRRYDVCAHCVMYRSAEASDKIDKMEKEQK